VSSHPFRAEYIRSVVAVHAASALRRRLE
jgi:hypothetical protein